MFFPKYVKIAVLFGGIGLLIASCNDSFLEIRPDNATDTDETFIESKADAQEVLNGAYKALSYSGFLGGNAQFLSECMADNINGEALTNGDYKAHYSWTTDIFLGTTRSLIRDGYKSIARANFLMERINQATDATDAEKNQMVAEAKFIRGVAHFEEVRLFAQPYGYTADNSQLGVPLRLRFGIQPENRATVQAVYDQVITDLTDAAAALPTSNGVYATSWAAKGMLAKVYFQMNDFQNAYAMANDVISNGGFALDASPVGRFATAGSAENVFALVGDDVNSNNAGKRFRDDYRIDPGNNAAQVYVSNSMYNFGSSNTADLRDSLFYKVVSDGPPQKLVALVKFPTEVAMTVPLVSLTELKLIRAESAAELDTNLGTAAADVNDIINRAGLVGAVSSDKDIIISEARTQRRLELVGEGHRLHELKRQAIRDNPGLKIRAIAPWDCNGMVCQLPDAELAANPDMQPNPSGGCQ